MLPPLSAVAIPSLADRAFILWSQTANKPSAIVTYSPGPFGGSRAAMALRPMLSELGCLPVSKLCCIPTANTVFKADGTPEKADDRLLNQLPDMLAQLEWLAIAMKNQRARTEA